jgi:DHA2 family multidrug resistance protein-like MFS transporter
VVAAILNALAFGFLIWGADGVVREGLGVGLLRLGAGAIAAILLVRRELGQPAPLVPLDLLRIPIFGLSAATSIVSFAAQMLAYVALPFYFQQLLGHSAVQTGLLMTPWPLATGIAAPIAGKLADRYPAGLLGGIGLAVFALGLAALSMIHPGASNIQIVWRMAVCGLGFGFFQSPNNRAMVASAPLHRSGAAGGMLATARLLGQTAGAVSAAMFFHLAGMRATTLALVTAAGVAAVGAGVSLLRLKLAPSSAEAPEDIGQVAAGP